MAELQRIQRIWLITTFPPLNPLNGGSTIWTADKAEGQVTNLSFCLFWFQPACFGSSSSPLGNSERECIRHADLYAVVLNCQRDDVIDRHSVGSRRQRRRGREDQRRGCGIVRDRAGHRRAALRDCDRIAE